MKPHPGRLPRRLAASSKHGLWRRATNGKWPSSIPKGLKSAPERERNEGEQRRRILFAFPSQARAPRKRNISYFARCCSPVFCLFCRACSPPMMFRSTRVSPIPTDDQILECPREKSEVSPCKLSRRRYITEREESQCHEYLQEGTDALKQKLMKRCHAEELVDRRLESVFRLARP